MLVSAAFDPDNAYLTLTFDRAVEVSAFVPSQVVAQEIVRSSVATIGLIAAVPLTTALAAWAHRSRSVSG